MATLALALSLAATPVFAASGNDHRSDGARHVWTSHQRSGRHVGTRYAGSWQGGRRHDERSRYGGYRGAYDPGYYGQGNYDHGYDGPGYGPDIGLGLVGGIIGAATGAMERSY